MTVKIYTDKSDIVKVTYTDGKLSNIQMLRVNTDNVSWEGIRHEIQLYESGLDKQRFRLKWIHSAPDVFKTSPEYTAKLTECLIDAIKESNLTIG